MVALYATIWIALVALLLGELGRRRNRQTGVTTRWAIVCSAVGVVFTAAHILLALGVVYDWDHARAATVTAQRASTVYGVAWPLSLYVNYIFLGWWLADTLWWWRSTPSFLARSPLIEWAWRLTAFTMVINGAVIFASPAGRLAGIPLTAALLFVWWHSPSNRSTCLLVGLAPALRATRTAPIIAMRGSGRGITDGRGRFTLRRTLVVGQLRRR